MTINNNSVEQINVALLDMDKKLKSAASKSASASDFKNLEASVDNIKKTLNETKTGLEPGKTYNINISGNAATAYKAKEAEKANKLVNALTVNGETYDGSEAVDTGVQKIENGGTGVTTQADINKAFIGDLEVGNSDVTDGTEFVSSYASDNGFADSNALNKPYKRQFIKVWNYIKGKISSVLGLTSEKVSSYDSHLSNKDNPHSVTKSQVGLGSVVNTGDSAIPVSGGTTKFTTGGAYTELNKKVDKVDGKGLSSNDFTNTYKDKLDNTDTTVTANSSNLVTSGAVATAISTEVTNRNTAITNAINNLDVSSVGGDGKYISAISETNGKISATSTTMDTAPTTNSVKAVTSGGIKTAISTAETNAKNLANATGTLAIANGGTGATTQADINKAFVGALEEGISDVTDGTMFVSSWASDNGFAYTDAVNTPYKRKFLSVWNYIKDKISSVLGLTKDNYGGKAATATIADSAKNMYSQTLDLSALDKTKFYPVVCLPSSAFAEVAVFSLGGPGSAEYNQNRIHFDISTQGWSDEPFTLNIREYACFDNKEITIGCIGRGIQYGAWAIWLRGGIKYYCYTRNCGLSLQTSDYTYGDEVYTVGTNYYGGTNSNVRVVFTPQSTITDGAYSSRPITAPAVKATIGFTGNLTGNVTGNVSGSSGSAGKLTTARKTYVTLGTASTTTTRDWSEDTTIPVDGTLPVANGGTGQTTANAAANAFINSLTTGESVPEDNDYFISQYVNGGTTTTTYHRRPVSKLWEYIKSKISSVLGLTATAYGGKASTAGTADKTVNDITIKVPFVKESGQYVIPFGNIPEPTSTAVDSPYNWDITGFLSIIRPAGHNGSNLWFEAGHGYSHYWTTYAYLDKLDFRLTSTSIKAFQYEGKWWLGLCISTFNQGYSGKMTITYSRGLPATPTCILYNSRSDGVANEEIYNSIQDIPSSWWKTRTIDNPTTFTQNITAPVIQARDSGKAATLYLNNNGGNVEVGGSGVSGAKLVVHGVTVSSNSYTDTNPKLEFKNNDGSQNVSLTFTDFDAVQAPASLTLNGNQGNEYFIAPNIKATTKFIGNLTGNVTGNVSGSSGSAGKLTTARTAYVDLGTASTTRTIDWSGDTTIPVNGVLQVEHGGTGATSAEAAANSLIASLSASNGVPVDSDYFISQVVNGGPFVPGYERRPISKLWEYIKGKILQEGEDFGYNHIVYDDASLLEWANCTDGHMKKVLVKSGTYNMTKGVDFSKAGTGYVFAENGAVINSKVPIAFSAPSGKTAVHNLKVVCGPSSDNTCAFSASDILNLILYDCEAGYATNTITVDRNLFSKCTCYNCHYNFTYSSSNSSMSIKVFYQCYCYNCICKQTIAANSSSAVSFATNSFFYMECVCISCDAELTTLRNIKAATPSFSCYYNCWDRCVGCLSTINVNSKALTVYSTLYGFLRCQHMSSCKEVHTVGYTNIKGVVQCIYISSTSAVSGESNTNVGNSCSIQ